MGGAKLLFVATGFLTQLALPRLLGSPEEWGRLKTAMTVTAIVTNTLVAAILQTVSKRGSESASDAEDAKRALRELLLVHGIIGVALAALMVGLAPLLGHRFFHNDALIPLLQVESIVVGSYAVYATLMGSLNGAQRFTQQAGLDMGFSLLRTAGLVGGAALGLGALGALSGLAAAAVAITFAALAVVGTGVRSRAVDLQKWRSFFLPIALYQGCLNGILMIDLPLMHWNVAELAIAAGDPAPDEVASRFTGFYGAAQTFAFVPYQLALSGTHVLFPVISRASSSGDEEGTRKAIASAMRFSLLALLAMAAPIAGAADGVLLIAYPAEYTSGADALRILAPGVVCFTLFVVGATALAGRGLPALAARVAAVAAVVVIVANIVLVRAVPLGEYTPIAAAAGTALGASISLAIVGVVVYRTFGAFLAPLTVLRACIAALVGAAVAWAIPHESRVMAFVACVMGGLSYLGTLAALRELGAADLELVRRVLRR